MRCSHITVICAGTSCICYAHGPLMLPHLLLDTLRVMPHIEGPEQVGMSCKRGQQPRADTPIPLTLRLRQGQRASRLRTRSSAWSCAFLADKPGPLNAFGRLHSTARTSKPAPRDEAMSLQHMKGLGAIRVEAAPTLTIVLGSRLRQTTPWLRVPRLRFSCKCGQGLLRRA